MIRSERLFIPWYSVGDVRLELDADEYNMRTERGMATWETVSWLPDPPKFPELEGELPEPMVCSLHFLGDNGDVLLVMYLDHGVM